MNKKIYLVRHCESMGQSAEAKLTEKGFKQALEVSEFFKTIKIDRIISSPFIRAIQTAAPLSQGLDIKIEVEERLVERTLSKNNLPNWFEKLKSTFDDLDLKFDGGESSRTAMNRIVQVINESLETEESIVVVTHGNLMSLLLMNYDKNFNFNCWKNLTNPDIFLLDFTNDEVKIERLWKK